MLENPEHILSEAAIGTTWAHYNRRYFDRTPRKLRTNGAATTTPTADADASTGAGAGVPGELSTSWVSRESKPDAVAEGSAQVKIPKDVSDNTDKLRKRLHETLRMYEMERDMDMDRDGQKERDRESGERQRLKETLIKTIENRSRRRGDSEAAGQVRVVRENHIDREVRVLRRGRRRASTAHVRAGADGEDEERDLLPLGASDTRSRVRFEPVFCIFDFATCFTAACGSTRKLRIVGQCLAGEDRLMTGMSLLSCS